MSRWQIRGRKDLAVLLLSLGFSWATTAGCEQAAVELEPEPLVARELHGPPVPRSSAGTPHPLARLSRQLAPSASSWRVASATIPPIRPDVSAPRPSPRAVRPRRERVAPSTRAASTEASQPETAPALGGEAPHTEVSGPARLNVRRLVVTDGIHNREPVKNSPLQAGTRPILAFVELESGAGQAHPIVVSFQHRSGAEVGFVELKIPPNKRRWRTWASTRRLTRPGPWVAVVRGARGQVLSRKAFVLDTPPPSAPAQPTRPPL